MSQGAHVASTPFTASFAHDALQFDQQNKYSNPKLYLNFQVSERLNPILQAASDKNINNSSFKNFSYEDMLAM